MTTVRFGTRDGAFSGVTCKGHTGYAEAGEDIVCAAVSSVVQTALLGLLTVAKIKVDFLRIDNEGKLSFALPDGLDEKKAHDAQVILDTMLCGVSDLREGFSDFINLEVI